MECIHDWVKTEVQSKSVLIHLDFAVANMEPCSEFTSRWVDCSKTTVWTMNDKTNTMKFHIRNTIPGRHPHCTFAPGADNLNLTGCCNRILNIGTFKDGPNHPNVTIKCSDFSKKYVCNSMGVLRNGCIIHTPIKNTPIAGESL